MNNIKLLHVGLGKCGSNYLEAVFEKISIETNIKTIDIDKFIDNALYDYYLYLLTKIYF